jgi:hypothetical protein
MDGLLDDELQQISESSAFLERMAGNDPLDQLPALIPKKIISDYQRGYGRLWRRHNGAIR